MLGNLAAWVTGALDGVFDNTSDEFESENGNLIDLQCGRTVFNDVPSKMRSELWASQLHKHSGAGSAAVVKYSSLASSLLHPDIVSEISRDTHRTFPGHKWLSGRAGQLAMLRVLRAYAVFDPEVGYTQGMNFLAGLFLAYLDEPQAFGALVLVMQDRGLRALYLPNDGMALLQVRLWQLGRLMPPRLSTHLENHAALPVLYSSSWFLTCFSADFPMHFAARVMDLVVTDCYAAPLMKVAVHILERCEKELLEMEDLEEMVDFLRKDVPKWPRGKLQDLLTEALGRGWTVRQSEVLKEINGAESVAEAVARVDLALAAGTTTTTAGDEDSDNPTNKPTTSSAAAEASSVPTSPSSSKTAGISSSPKSLAAESTAAAATPSASATPSTPNKLTLPTLPPPPTSRKDKIEWSKWRPSTPVLKAMNADNIKIQTEINEVALDPVLSRELSTYLGKNDAAAMCALPSPVFERENVEERITPPSDSTNSFVIDRVTTEMRVQSSGFPASPSSSSPQQGLNVSGGQDSSIQIPSPFETRSHASSSMGTHHSEFEKSLLTGEFSDFTGASDAAGGINGGGVVGVAKEETPSWGQSAADSIAYLLGNFSMGYKPQPSDTDPAVGGDCGGAGTSEKRLSDKNLAGHETETLHPLESIAESPSSGALPAPGLSGFGSWRVAEPSGTQSSGLDVKTQQEIEISIKNKSTRTSPNAAAPTVGKDDTAAMMMTSSSSVQMSPANSKAMLLQQAHLKEFSASAKTPQKNRWT